MKKIIHKARNHKDAKLWDIEQQINMTPAERQRAAKEIKKRVYGEKVPAMREKRK